MPSLTANWISDQFDWSTSKTPTDEVLITIGFLGKLTKRAALQKLRKRVAEGTIDWLRHEKKNWWLDVDRLKGTFPNLKLHGNWRGQIPCEPEVEDENGGTVAPIITQVVFSILPDEVPQMQGRKIFLSHKGEDKKLVRRFQRALEVIGYEVWLDEKNLKAGDQLERGILKGFEESCAAVFFITENFKDERYLKAEINYAIAQVRTREEHFKIITLAFKKGRSRVEIPSLLKSYVWKSPATELDAFVEIVKALPPVLR
jgi:hypothetical protein